ncbi:hypothetical protein A1D31_32750 [Bradyrhizobium liaoningense]|nr:hypothetical protein A1D31_32750 [Bradyrhizobium liaoningense]
MPKKLLLKCEGTLTILLSKPTVDSLKPRRFETTLRLEDGELVDTGSRFLNTGDCALRKGVVACTGKAVYPSTIDNGSEAREMESYIDRETGEYNFLMETIGYTGRNATGKRTGGMKYRRSGICRPIGNPIF